MLRYASFDLTPSRLDLAPPDLVKTYKWPDHTTLLNLTTLCIPRLSQPQTSQQLIHVDSELADSSVQGATHITLSRIVERIDLSSPGIFVRGTKQIAL